MTDVAPRAMAVISPSPTVLVSSRESGVTEIWLNRPDKMNALSVELATALLQVIEDAIASGATALVIRARGKAFCAGADLKERLTMTPDERYAHNRKLNAFINALDEAPIPTIAVIQGTAMGGGLEMALGCDIRIAAESAQIGLTEARIGAIPGAGGTQRLPRLVGVSNALFMMYVGEPVTAKRAMEIGLVNQCVADDELNSTVEHYVGLLGARSPTAVRTLKQVVREGVSLPLADGLERERLALGAIFASADYAEGIAAFSEKRPPRFGR